MIAERGDERQMGDAEYLARAAELRELAADGLRDGAADAGIDLVEDEGGAVLLGGREGLQGEHDPRELAARGDPGERPRLLAGVGREEELDLVPALGPERSPLAEADREAGVLKGERRELAGEIALELARHAPALDGEPPGPPRRPRSRSRPPPRHPARRAARRA